MRQNGLLKKKQVGSDMEVWKDVIGYEGLYQVSNLGRVKSLARRCKTWNGERGVPEKILIGGLDTDGYKQVTLCNEGHKTTWKVHRLVCLAFLPNPENKPSINHKNAIKTDNKLENLEWSTVKENTIHAHENGLCNPRRGEDHGKSYLTKQQVIDIKYNLSHLSNQEVGKLFNMNWKTVWCIRKGRTWKHI